MKIMTQTNEETRVGYATLARLRDIYNEMCKEKYDLGLAEKINRLDLILDKEVKLPTQHLFFF